MLRFTIPHNGFPLYDLRVQIASVSFSRWSDLEGSLLSATVRIWPRLVASEVLPNQALPYLLSSTVKITILLFVSDYLTPHCLALNSFSQSGFCLRRLPSPPFDIKLLRSVPAASRVLLSILEDPKTLTNPVRIQSSRSS